ncbi:uncharacterized protein LOC113290416 [Papaver somniferum]|uniref:uncharacterized protein LOC113290416 n=1 Tax=Papaver somniferum TaxID=3469 RepID=UPI000E6FA9EA|nr:uncharacterized protein LOC113290416 [Papaver somniferum]
MNELTEYQEEYIALEEKQRQVSEVTPLPAKEGNSRLLPRTVHVVEDDPKYEKEEPSTPVPVKLVVVSSGDLEWIDQQRYHRFHGHHTNDCRNIQRIILRLVEQGKLAHFLEGYVQTPQPPPRDNKQVYRIEIDRGTHKLNCNSIIYSSKSIQNFHDNIFKRVHKRDFEGNEIFSMAKKEPLEEWQKREITFSAKDAPEGGASHTETLVVTLNFGKYSKWEDDEVKKEKIWAIDRILVVTGSSINILFYHAFRTMGYKYSDLVPSTYNIYGFNGVASKPKEELVVKIFACELETKVTICVIDIDSPYNALIGRPWIHVIKGVASAYYQAMRIPMPSGIGEIKGDLKDARDCIEKDVHNYDEKLRRKI